MLLNNMIDFSYKLIAIRTLYDSIMHMMVGQAGIEPATYGVGATHDHIALPTELPAHKEVHYP